MALDFESFVYAYTFNDPWRLSFMTGMCKDFNNI